MADSTNAPNDKDCTLKLHRSQLSHVDRALTGFARALQAARDLGIISHETFCHEADAVRAVQYSVWESTSEGEHP